VVVAVVVGLADQRVYEEVGEPQCLAFCRLALLWQNWISIQKPRNLLAWFILPLINAALWAEGHKARFRPDL